MSNLSQTNKRKNDFEEDDLNPSPKRVEDPSRKTSRPKKHPNKTGYNDDEQTVNIKKPKEKNSFNTGNGNNESSQRPHEDNTTHVKIYPMLLTFIGVPDSKKSIGVPDKKSIALKKLVPRIRNDYDRLSFSHNQFVVRDFHDNHAEMQFEGITSMRSLESGNRLVNIWDIGVNRAIIPFLYRFSGHYLLNYMWLFIDLDNDLSQLHIPPVVHDPLLMKWRSRLQYLFRSCHLSKSSKREGGVCKIFATYNVLHVDEDLMSHNNLRRRLAILRKECNIVAQQMGVKELVDIELIPINMESNKAEKILKDNMQALFEQLQPKQIPESWMCLRDLLARHSSTCITKPELQHEALKYGITNEHLGEFCRLFTSFGSILDVQLIDPNSEYIIIQPNEFLIKLNDFFVEMQKSDSTLDHGVISHNELSTFENECEKKVFMNILCSAGFATVVPSTAIVNDTIIPGPAFYIPSVRTDTPELTCTRGSIKLVLGMESSPMNVPIKITDYLLRTFNDSQLILTASPNQFMIGIKILEDLLKIEITSHCDVIEIVSHGKEKYGVMYKNVCQRIAEFCSKMAQRMTDQSRIMKYHFAITCESDRYKEMGYNIYHRRHVLPSENLCKICRVMHIDDGQITVWNKILTETPIEPKFKLNGLSLTVPDIIALADEIIHYPHTALHMFAEELEIEHPIEPDVTSFVFKVLNWSASWQTESGESAKKALARKLMNLDAYWQEKIQRGQYILDIAHRNVNFGLCARQLDIQVYAEYQLQHIDTDILLPKDDQDLKDQLQQKEDELKQMRIQLSSAQMRIEKLEALLSREFSPSRETKSDPFSHVCHCVLGIKDHNVVFVKCMKFQNDWKYIGSGLGISFGSLQTIEVNRADIRSRMFDMLALWFKMDSEYQPYPTWNKLLKTLYSFDRIETENISTNFVCQHK